MPRSALWRHQDFVKLWSGQTISQFGTAITELALPLVAINQLHAGAGQVGALTAVQFAPFILIGLPAGVWVDRLRRRPLLLVGDAGRAVVLAVVPIAYWLDALAMWELYAVAFAVGALTVFFDVSYQSYLPSLVERDQLADGNSKLEITRSAAQIAGPGLGGALIGAVTAPVAILADAVSYVFSFGAVAWIRRPEHPPKAPGPEAGGRRPRMRTEIAEGLRYVLGHRLLRPIAICTATSNLFTSILQAVLILFMVRRLHFGAGVIGLVFGVGNVGFLVGAALTQRLDRALGVGRAIVLAMAWAGPFLFLIPLAAHVGLAPLLLGTTQFGVSLGAVVYNISQVSLRQAICPDRLQGRMNASMRFMVWGTMPIGAAIGGWLGATVGITATLWIAAAGMCLAFVAPALSPVWGLRTIAEAEEQEAAMMSPAAHDGVVVPGELPPFPP